MTDDLIDDLREMGMPDCDLAADLIEQLRAEVAAQSASQVRYAEAARSRIQALEAELARAKTAADHLDRMAAKVITRAVAAEAACDRLQDANNRILALLPHWQDEIANGHGSRRDGLCAALGALVTALGGWVNRDGSYELPALAVTPQQPEPPRCKHGCAGPHRYRPAADVDAPWQECLGPVGVAAQPTEHLPIAHKAPRLGEGVTACCGKTPFELPRSDQLTEHAELVSCPDFGAAQPTDPPSVDLTNACVWDFLQPNSTCITHHRLWPCDLVDPDPAGVSSVQAEPEATE